MAHFFSKCYNSKTDKDIFMNLIKKGHKFPEFSMIKGTGKQHKSHSIGFFSEAGVKSDFAFCFMSPMEKGNRDLSSNKEFKQLTRFNG